LTSMKRTSRLVLTARVRPFHYKRLLRVAEQVRCRVAVQSKHGAYALFLRLLNRPVLIVCLVLALLAGVMSTQFVLDVRVIGVTGNKASKVLSAAYDLGAKRWALWAKLDQGSLQRTLEQHVPFAQKVLVHKNGVTMDIEIVPYTDGPVLFKSGDVCDLVSDQYAVIESVIALDGTPTVGKGDVVRPGDVLIRGTFIRNIDEGKQRFVQARGIVIGRVGFMGEAKVSLDVKTYEKTGREQNVRSLCIAGWKIPLTGKATFAQSILAAERIEPIIGGVLPANVTTLTYAEVITVTNPRIYSEAESTAIGFAARQAQATMPLQGTNVQQVVHSELTDDGFVLARVYLTVSVPIGIENKQMVTDPLLYYPW
jgi:sporulation protein YqfD